jgi:hypothetical protein
VVEYSVLGDFMKHSVDGTMTIEHFVSFSRTHQALFHEVFTLQRRMRKRTLGIEYWHAVSQRRIELMAGRFVPLADLMILVGGKTGAPVCHCVSGIRPVFSVHIQSALTVNFVCTLSHLLLFICRITFTAL